MVKFGRVAFICCLPAAVTVTSTAADSRNSATSTQSRCEPQAAAPQRGIILSLSLGHHGD